MYRFPGEGAPITGSTDDITRFFAQSRHCKSEVLKFILSDISTLCVSLNFSRRCTTWGATQQRKLCIYGGLPINLKVSSTLSPDNTQQCVGEITRFVLPVQLWLTPYYPIDPPIVFLLSNEAGCKVASNNKYVDVTGRCHVPELAAWKPKTSSLCVLVESIGNVLEEEGICPLHIGAEPLLTPSVGPKRSNCISASELKKDVGEPNADVDNEAEEGDQCVVCLGPKDTVLVPCGHYCLCGACSTNLSNCPICRDPVKFRQRVFA